MSKRGRIRRQQILREVEGYLDLIMSLADRWSLDPSVRDRVAQRALDMLDRIEDPGQDAGEVDYLRGQALRAMQRYTEAITPLQEAALWVPEDIHIHLALGWCYKRIGHLDRAIEALEAALVADPGEPILYFNLACYWSLAGNKKQVLDYLSRAIIMDSRYREMVATESDFDRYRDDQDFHSLITSVIV